MINSLAGQALKDGCDQQGELGVLYRLLVLQGCSTLALYFHISSVLLFYLLHNSTIVLCLLYINYFYSV